MKHLAVLLALAAAPAVAQNYGGFVDEVDCSLIAGWAWDSNQPNTPVSVSIFSDNVQLATIPAGTFRSDLLGEGLGNGYHAYYLPVPSAIKDNRRHNISVAAGGTYPLISSGTSLQLQCNAGATGYQYYYSDGFGSLDLGRWSQTGAFTTGVSGLNAPGSSNSSLVSSVAVPGDPSQYEVKAMLNLQSSGGSFILYLRAAADASSYYSVELQNVTWQGSACAADLLVNKMLSGVATTLSYAQVVCRNGITMRAVMRNNGIFAFLDGQIVAEVADNDITARQPGVGGREMAANNGFSQVQLGPLDSTGPSAVDPTTVAVWATPHCVNLQWQTPPDDQNGTGVERYDLYRDGVVLEGAFVGGVSDCMVNPGETHTYNIYAIDYHQNFSPRSGNITVTVPPAGAIDPRRVGVHPLGSYWGAMGEQIDTRSGNLNYTLPLVKPMGRGGWGVQLSLSYNSQQWRQESSTDWNLGQDVGYGYGWRLMAGFILPYWWGFYAIDHYVFTDASGAEYRLDVNNNGIWTSKEGTYVAYDATNQKLYFPDGSFWVMGCTSAGTEPDAGTMYPIQMEDTNGNYINLVYLPGNNISWNNSSARISTIEDVRSVQPGMPYNQTWISYQFNYNSDPIPHLISITPAAASMQESYYFSYSQPQNLSAPFDNQFFGVTTLLTTVNGSVAGAHSFNYAAGSAELTQAALPYGGWLRWAYTNAAYVGSRTQREVQYRYLRKASGAPETTYTFAFDAGDANRTVHWYKTLIDGNGVDQKVWVFGTNPGLWYTGLQTEYQERSGGAGNLLRHDLLTWTQDGNGTPYIGATNTTLDESTANAVTMRTEQTVDTHGNVVQTKVYDYAAGGNAGPLLRTTTNGYLSSSNYTSRYIFNRLGGTSVANGSGQAATVVSNAYDQYTTTMLDTPGVRQHDSAYSASLIYRGNITSQTTPTGTVTHGYDIVGNTTTVQSGTGSVQLAATSATNYYVPSTVTPNGNSNLGSSFQFNGAMELTSAAMPNGSTSSATYDSAGQPLTTTSVYGATTTYTYNYGTGANVTATTVGDSGTRWVRSTTDGLGRTIKVEKGTGPLTNQVTLSVTESVYGPCACSPMGKVVQVSQPHAPNATPVWTTYTYDARGRTLTMVKPDGSTTLYAYTGNYTTVTDAAGNWKIFKTDGAGNLVQVVEPNPAGGMIITAYSYNAMGKLTQVNMAGQIRTFTYDQGGQGSILLSAANPENGTVTYTYNSDGTLATKHDARSQTIQYSYDNYKRLTQVTRPDGQDNYYYDTYSVSGFTSQYAWGRLAAVTFQGVNGVTDQGTSAFTNLYSYTVPGQVSAKRLRLLRSGITPQAGTLDLEADYTYDNEGRTKTVTYPGGQVFTYSYDGMGRSSALAQTAGDRSMYGLIGGQPPQFPVPLASGASYGPAGELLQFSSGNANGWVQGWTEYRSYNSLLQLTSIVNGGYPSQTLSYTYPDGANIGKISQQWDSSSGEQVQYQYDALGRLNRAETAPQSQGAPWGYSYSYDVYGTLTGKTVTKGSPSAGGPFWGATDANGNLTQTPGGTGTYDSQNRLTSIAAAEFYGYDPSNKRVQKIQPSGEGYNEYIYFYGASGEMLCTYLMNRWSTYPYYQGDARCNLHFAGQRLARWGGGSGFSLVKLDRLGTEGGVNYYPWGEEKVTTAQNTEKFATYYRDATSGLDYADQRYYSSIMGRFLTPDPSDAGDLTDPQSLNLYSYVLNDPVNYNDPEGLDVNIPLENGGSATSCLNHTLMPWFQSHGINIGNNFGNYGNTNGGILALTLYFEDTRGSQSEYQALAQVFSNRYNLEKSNPTLARSLFGSIGTSIASVAENTSNVWANGSLRSNFQNQLGTLIDTEVVGSSNAVGAAACNGLLQAMNVASDALSKIFDVSSITHYSVGSLNNSTYWFYNVGTTNPVNQNYWSTSTWNLGAFTFENLIGPKQPPSSPNSPGGGRSGGKRRKTGRLPKSPANY